MTELQIRTAHVDELEQIIDVTLAAYQQYMAVAQELWEWYQQNIKTTLGDFRPAELIVAEQEDAIVGSVLLYPAGTVLTHIDENAAPFRWPEIRLLAVQPASRGQGIGAALVSECIERARQAGVEAVTLHTLDFMKSAMQMYEGMGFVRFPELDVAASPEYYVKAYRYTL